MPVSASRKLRIQRKKERKKERKKKQNKEKRWVRRTTEIKSKNNSDKFCLWLAGAGLCSTHTTQNSPCHCHRLLSAILSCHNTKQSMSLSHTAILSDHNTKKSMSLSQAAKYCPVASQHKTVHVTVTHC